MTLLLASLLSGILLGFLAGGNLRRLEELSLRYEWLLLGALVFQLSIPMLVPRFDGVSDVLLVWVLWLPAAGVSAAVALLNRRQVGMAIVAAGILLNVLVVSVNGGMPVLIENAVGVQEHDARQSIERSWLHVESGSETRLLILGDVIPLPGPKALGGLASLGDAVLSIGAGVFLAFGMALKRVVGEGQS